MTETTVQPQLDGQATQDRWLLRSAWAFGVVVLLHNADHVRRGADTIGLDVVWVGSLAVIVEIAVVVLAVQRHRLAPLAAAAAGLGLAAGYLVVHFLPARSWLSDSLVSGADVSAVTWIAASAELAASVVLAVVGFVVLQARGGLVSATHPHPPQRPAIEAWMHPLSAVVSVGLVAMVVVSFAQL